MKKLTYKEAKGELLDNFSNMRDTGAALDEVLDDFQDPDSIDLINQAHQDLIRYKAYEELEDEIETTIKELVGKTPTVNIQVFEDELIQFIKDHQYVKEQDADPGVIRENDGITVNLHTVNGEFERVVIRMDYIG